MTDRRDSKNIGSLNGGWAMMFKIGMSLMTITLPLLVTGMIWIGKNQVLDNAFRNEGERFTRQDAELMTRIIIDEIMDEIKSEMSAHAALVGHPIMDRRVGMLEQTIDRAMFVEQEETEILRAMQQDIARHTQWLRERAD